MKYDILNLDFPNFIRVLIEKKLSENPRLSMRSIALNCQFDKGTLRNCLESSGPTVKPHIAESIINYFFSEHSDLRQLTRLKYWRLISDDPQLKNQETRLINKLKDGIDPEDVAKIKDLEVSQTIFYSGIGSCLSYRKLVIFDNPNRKTLMPFFYNTYHNFETEVISTSLFIPKSDNLYKSYLTQGTLSNASSAKLTHPLNDSFEVTFDKKGLPSMNSFIIFYLNKNQFIQSHYCFTGENVTIDGKVFSDIKLENLVGEVVNVLKSKKIRDS